MRVAPRRAGRWHPQPEPRVLKNGLVKLRKPGLRNSERKGGQQARTRASGPGQSWAHPLSAPEGAASGTPAPCLAASTVFLDIGAASRASRRHRATVRCDRRRVRKKASRSRGGPSGPALASRLVSQPRARAARARHAMGKEPPKGGARRRCSCAEKKWRRARAQGRPGILLADGSDWPRTRGQREARGGVATNDRSSAPELAGRGEATGEGALGASACAGLLHPRRAASAWRQAEMPREAWKPAQGSSFHDRPACPVGSLPISGRRSGLDRKKRAAAQRGAVR